MFVPLEIRIQRKLIRRGPDECWEWKGSKDQYGYALINVEGRSVRVSRILAKAKEGEVGMHSCNNGWCVNHKHCIAGTHQTNNVDALRDGLRTGVTAPKFTMEQAEAIRTEGLSVKDLADKYGVSYTVIYDILRYRTYRQDHSRKEQS